MEKLRPLSLSAKKETVIGEKLSVCATYFSALILASCAPYQEKTHAGPLAGPHTHGSTTRGNAHPPYYGHSHTHYLWNHPHTHPEPHKMDNFIDLRDRNGKITRIANPHPTYPNHPVIERAQQPETFTKLPEAEFVPNAYTVQPGDTAGEIAQRFQLPYGKLGELNPNVNLNSIKVGQILRIR